MGCDGDSRWRKSIKLELVSRKQSIDKKPYEFIALNRQELCILRNDGSKKIRRPNRNIRGMHVLRDVCYHSSAGVHLLASIGKEMSIFACSSFFFTASTVQI